DGGVEVLHLQSHAAAGRVGFPIRRAGAERQGAVGDVVLRPLHAAGLADDHGGLQSEHLLIKLPGAGHVGDRVTGERDGGNFQHRKGSLLFRVRYEASMRLRLEKRLKTREADWRRRWRMPDLTWRKASISRATCWRRTSHSRRDCSCCSAMRTSCFCISISRRYGFRSTGTCSAVAAVFSPLPIVPVSSDHFICPPLGRLSAPRRPWNRP